MRRRSLVMVAAVFALVGCESLLTDAQPYGSVSVVARSRLGTPLPNIRAELYSGTYRHAFGLTDDSGRVEFRFVPPGVYGVAMGLPKEYIDVSLVSSRPYGSIKDGILVERAVADSVSFTFAVAGPGSIEVQLRNQGGRLLDGVTVGFYGPTGVIGFAVSDSGGIARYDDLPFGNYGVFVDPPDSLGVADSPWIFRDGIIVTSDFLPRVRMTLPTCSGHVRVRVLDQDDARVPGATVFLYTSTAVSKNAVTDSLGGVRFLNAFCGNYGVILAPELPGYQIEYVRGSGFEDGIAVTNDTTLIRTLRVRRNP